MTKMALAAAAGAQVSIIAQSPRAEPKPFDHAPASVISPTR